jgi:acetylornithine aminotransferase
LSINHKGGIHPATPEFLNALREKCDEFGALLAFDEIQCGLGRTGKLFAYENFGVMPDLLTMAKPLANGIPIGAVILSPNVASQIALGDHGTTFGGSPFATKVGHTVFSIISSQDFLNNVIEMGQYLHSELLKFTFPAIKEIRGIGLMIGIELKEGYDTQEFVDHCRLQGLLCISAGSNTIRLVPPLIIAKEHIDEALRVFRHTFDVLSFI